MNHLSLFALLLVALSIFSCTDPAELEDQAWKEVMRIHDEVMPEMATINRIKRGLKAEMADTTATLSADRQTTLITTIQQLEAAEEGMMSWMEQVKSPAALRETLEHEAILSYLQDQQEKIEIVKRDMLTSIEAGQAVSQPKN
jgi:hypothetical protein